MTLLIDNDIVLKLAQLDLLDSATIFLKEKYGNLQVLNTLRYKFCPINEARRRKVSKRYNIDVIIRIEKFIDGHTSEIDCEVSDLSLIDAMANSEGGLDIGEMQLLQTLVASEGDIMFTGDKRFLRALADDSNVAVHSDKFYESFVCFEQILIFLIKKLGFDLVKRHYIGALDADLTVDTALCFCFEGREYAIERVVMENLSGYVRSLRAGTESLLSTEEDWMTEYAQPEVIRDPACV